MYANWLNRENLDFPLNVNTFISCAINKGSQGPFPILEVFIWKCCANCHTMRFRSIKMEFLPTLLALLRCFPTVGDRGLSLAVVASSNLGVVGKGEEEEEVAGKEWGEKGENFSR